MQCFHRIFFLQIDGGIPNGGFIGDNGYAIVDETTAERIQKKKKKRDSDKEDQEIADDLTGANGHAKLIEDEEEEEKKKEKKKKKKKKKDKDKEDGEEAKDEDEAEEAGEEEE